MQFILAFFIGIFSLFVFEKEQKTDARDIALDELGNLYLIHDSYIERVNSFGGGVFRSSDLNYGNIEYFDMTNPLKPFIFYKGAGKLVMFDNTLSEQGNAIDLFEKGYEQIELVCGSRGDFYWLWDSRNSEMIRVDANFQKISSTGNLSVLLAKEFQPVQILERGNHLYLRDPKFGIVVFDIYGMYKTTLKIFPKRDIQVLNDELIYADTSYLYVLSNNWLIEQKLELPMENTERVFYQNRKLYCIKDHVLSTWNFVETTRN